MGKLTPHSLLLLISVVLLFGRFASAASGNTNPAEELANLINANRTASSNLTSLYDNPGLACIALQYLHAFQQACNAVGQEKPPATSLNSTFADDCGIEPSTVEPLTGIILYCQDTYVGANEAFDVIMAKNNKSKSIIDNKNHTQLGVAVGSYGGGSPFFWCALFNDAASPNATYVFTKGKAVVQHEGCFSGTGDPCSDSSTLKVYPIGVLLLIALATVLLARF